MGGGVRWRVFFNKSGLDMQEKINWNPKRGLPIVLK